MTGTDAKVRTARQKQSESSKADLLDLMKSKSRSTLEFSLYLTDDEGRKHEVTLKYQAIGMREYDKLVSKHPPKPDQRAEGASFDMDSFAPALIAAVCVEPEMSLKDAQDIWGSPAWSRGDLMVLFRNAVELNNRGLDIPFSENG